MQTIWLLFAPFALAEAVQEQERDEFQRVIDYEASVLFYFRVRVSCYQTHTFYESIVSGRGTWRF